MKVIRGMSKSFCTEGLLFVLLGGEVGWRTLIASSLLATTDPTVPNTRLPPPVHNHHALWHHDKHNLTCTTPVILALQLPSYLSQATPPPQPSSSMHPRPSLIFLQHHRTQHSSIPTTWSPSAEPASPRPRVSAWEAGASCGRSWCQLWRRRASRASSFRPEAIPFLP